MGFRIVLQSHGAQDSQVLFPGCGRLSIAEAAYEMTKEGV